MGDDCKGEIIEKTSIIDPEEAAEILKKQEEYLLKIDFSKLRCCSCKK